MEFKLKEKKWSKEFEEVIYEEWKEKKIYGFDKESKKRIFSIDTPPPYVNAPVHIGQVTTYILMDMFARYRRMTGWEVLFPLGLDRNGLPIETAAEKKFNVRLKGLSREKALRLCNKILEEASMESTNSFLRCGISFNSWDIGTGIGEVYETDSPDYRALTQETFIDLWNKGLIYEDERINNWCPGCQTTLADAEIEYKEKETQFNDIIFKVKETGENIIIGTTRPELVCACGMVIFHPEDERYTHLEGKTAVIPLFEKEVLINAHPLADPEKGTGIVMMCSAGDLSDIRFFREMKLEPIICINKDGTMNANAGFLKGLTVKQSRKKIIEELKKNKLLVKQVKTTHRTPVCERSKDEIEFISMSELYLKQVEFKKDLKKLAKQLNFFSEQSRQILINWIESVSIDWPISRRRFYATEVPLWYCTKCGYAVLPKKGRYCQPWKEKAPVKQCGKCGNKMFRGDERVFDTWFDSSISPLYILKWKKNEEFFKKSFPCFLRPQGKEIIRTWLYYTLLKCYLLTSKCIFKDVWINYHITDEKGYKMSKSAGNVINPKDILDQHGAEPLRLWAVVEGNITKTDFRCSFERIEGEGKTITKLWNIARFISLFEKEKKPKKLMELDAWILKEANKLVEEARKRYEEYDFHNPCIKIKHFIWETFASHYIELVKNRAYNQDERFTKEAQQSALYTLHKILETILKLMAPVNPMITYKIYKELRNEDIHSERFPEPEKYESELETEEIEILNSEVWKTKKDKGLSLKEPVRELVLPEKYKKMEQDLQVAHNAQKITYGRELKVIV